ncbi:MAG: CopD family protein [Gemmatimonadota bacterium]|nr:CopD family protein [Gemmatimonadota bacterium]
MSLTLLILLHVLGATIWTGGHLVLTLTVLPRALRARDPKIVEEFEGGFERLGIPALVLQVVTGLWLAFRRLPDFGSWFAFDSFVSTYIFVKLMLLVATLALAMHARLRLLPSLGPDNLKTLAWHIVAVTILSVLFVVMGVGLRTGGIF